MRELKMIVSITKVGPEKQMLYRDELCMDDNNPLTSTTSRAAPRRPKHRAQWGSLFGIPTPESSRPSN